MRSVAEMLQRNPSLVLVLLVGLPSLTWAAAYARRPSRARRLFAGGALALTLAIAAVATLEAARGGAPWWPALVLAGAIAAVWSLFYFRVGRS
ncbi:MAG TPA: hypothetical protein VF997_15690 [Polyangia bacterium]